jgi:hypothetical protein
MSAFIYFSIIDKKLWAGVIKLPTWRGHCRQHQVLQADTEWRDKGASVI